MNTACLIVPVLISFFFSKCCYWSSAAQAKPKTITLMTPTNIIETVQCCYLSEEDCCNGIGPDRVVNRECCASVFFPPSPFVSTLLTLSMQQNRRAQLKGRDSWLIFSQDSVAPFSSVVRFPDGVGPGAILT